MNIINIASQHHKFKKKDSSIYMIKTPLLALGLILIYVLCSIVSTSSSLSLNEKNIYTGLCLTLDQLSFLLSFFQKVDILILYKSTYYVRKFLLFFPPFLTPLCAYVCVKWQERRGMAILTEIYHWNNVCHGIISHWPGRSVLITTL